MNDYQALEATFHTIAQRNPAWVDELFPPPGPAGVGSDAGIGVQVGGARLHAVVRIVHSQLDVVASDAMIRRLAELGHGESDALTVLLHGLARRMQRRIRHNALAEYHADALAELTMILIEGPLNGTHLAPRLVNRAHSRVWQARQREHQKGRTKPMTLQVFDPDVLARIGDRRGGRDDVADLAVIRADLAGFASAVQRTIAEGGMKPNVWTNYRDFQLRRELVIDNQRNGRDRVRAHRAAQSLDHLIHRHLVLHAA